jgi:hypothetical protein
MNPETSQPSGAPYARVVSLTAARSALHCFRPLLEQGFQVEVRVGRSIAEVLNGQLGVPLDYLSERVQTVFLNGRAIDDEASAVVEDGDRLALSASMPGLAGATLRKSGFFSGLRAAISHRGSQQPAAADSNGTIRIKLFNMIAVEIGPLFLARGIGIPAKAFSAFWSALGPHTRTQIQSAAVDGRSCDPARLKPDDWDERLIGLQVKPI